MDQPKKFDVSETAVEIRELALGNRILELPENPQDEAEIRELLSEEGTAIEMWKNASKIRKLAGKIFEHLEGYWDEFQPDEIDGTNPFSIFQDIAQAAARIRQLREDPDCRNQWVQLARFIQHATRRVEEILKPFLRDEENYLFQVANSGSNSDYLTLPTSSTYNAFDINERDVPEVSGYGGPGEGLSRVAEMKHKITVLSQTNPLDPQISKMMGTMNQLRKELGLPTVQAQDICKIPHSKCSHKEPKSFAARVVAEKNHPTMAKSKRQRSESCLRDAAKVERSCLSPASPMVLKESLPSPDTKDGFVLETKESLPEIDPKELLRAIDLKLLRSLKPMPQESLPMDTKESLALETKETLPAIDTERLPVVVGSIVGGVIYLYCDREKLLNAFNTNPMQQVAGWIAVLCFLILMWALILSPRLRSCVVGKVLSLRRHAPASATPHGPQTSPGTSSANLIGKPLDPLVSDRAL